jgi:hypothetical protein
MTTLEKIKAILNDGGQWEEDFEAFKSAKKNYLSDPSSDNDIALHLAFGTVHRDIKWARVGGRISYEDFNEMTEYLGDLCNSLE